MRVEAVGIEKVIKHLEVKKRRMEYDLKRVMELLAQSGIEVARAEYAQAQYDGYGSVQVGDVIWGEGGKECYVVASGEKVLFIEFGTGKAYPDHPRQGLVLPHGAYGAGRGQISRYPKGWVYVGPMGANPTPYAHHPRVVHKDGSFGEPQMDKVRTLGNPPAMAMYDAGLKMKQDVQRIAKEVFGTR